MAEGCPRTPAWAASHRQVLTGQQFQSPICEPYYVLFPGDYTHVEFYRWGLAEVCRREGGSFDGFSHATAWQPLDELVGQYEVG